MATQGTLAPKDDRVIMGVDPGTNIMGYAFIGVNGNRARLIAMGVIDLRKCKDMYMKLGEIFNRVQGLIASFLPDELAIEAPFFGKNVQSMLKLGRAQGVAMAAALWRGREVFEYAPSRIKQAIAGSGAASKEQVAGIVKRLLKIEYMPRRLDATDGMAVALCHYYTARTPISNAMGSARVKGLGGGKKAAKGSSSWEAFIRQNPEREIK